MKRPTGDQLRVWTMWALLASVLLLNVTNYLQTDSLNRVEERLTELEEKQP